MKKNIIAKQPEIDEDVEEEEEDDPVDEDDFEYDDDDELVEKPAVPIKKDEVKKEESKKEIKEELTPEEVINLSKYHLTKAYTYLELIKVM